RPLERGPTCASSTSIVPETAFFRFPHDEIKMGDPSTRSAQSAAAICFRRNNFLASGIEAANMQSADDSVKHFTMAGYSGTPLPQKLGIKPGTTVIVINEPPNYRKLLGKLDRVIFSNRISTNSDFVHLFTKRRSEFESRLSILREKIADNGTIWVSWPKKSAKVPTDITEDVVREIALPLGLVDIKVCAVDETWSGLKLMIRREKRKSR